MFNTMTRKIKMNCDLLLEKGFENIPVSFKVAFYPNTSFKTFATFASFYHDMVLFGLLIRLFC